MIIELELLGLLVIGAAALRKPKVAELPVREVAQVVEMVAPPASLPHPDMDRRLRVAKKNHAGKWQVIGHRHADHPDVHEALMTDGLAVIHPDGSVQEN